MIKRDTDVEVVSKATTNQRIGRSNVKPETYGVLHRVSALSFKGQLISFMVDYLTSTLEDQHIFLIQASTIDDQRQVNSKPAGLPEHASLNQCQLIAALRPELVIWAPPACGGDNLKVSL